MDAHRQGQFAAAAKLYSSVLSRNPRQADALHLLGVLHLQQGQFAKAVDLIGAAAAERPGDPDIAGNLAAALFNSRRLDEALAAYDRVLALQPQNAGAVSGRAGVLAGLGRFAEALGACDRALALRPGHPNALLYRGNALAGLKRWEDAVKSYDAAAAGAPPHFDLLVNRGNALCMLRDFDKGLSNFEQALALRPNAIEALCGRGHALKALGRLDEAVVAYEQVLAVNPDHADALASLSYALFDTDRLEEALPRFERLLALDPKNVETLKMLSRVLSGLGRIDDALSYGQAALAIDPSDAELFGLFLRHGRFAQGWPLFENRWLQQDGLRPRLATEPQWAGEFVEGVLYVWGEQGLGEQIIFSSMAEDLAKRARHLVLEVEPRLVSLFRRSFPAIKVVAPDGDEAYRGPVTAQTSLGSAGRYLRPDWAAFPSPPKPYLAADPGRAASLRARLAPDGAVTAGISWYSGNPRLSKFKSADLRDFESLLRLPNVCWIDLQYGDTSEQREAVEREFGVRIKRLEDIDNTNDIDGLAALIMACDVVATVSNTTAHLSGALGQQTFVLVPHVRGRLWYWFEDRPESPWYSRTNVRHRARKQSWPSLIGNVAGEVEAYAKEAGAARN